MTRKLEPIEVKTLEQLDALRARYITAEKPEEILFEVHNALNLWSSLRGYHYARLGHNTHNDPLPPHLSLPKEPPHDG